VVGLVASAERISQVRQHRVLGSEEHDFTAYTDRSNINEELVYARHLCTRHGWPMIDVTRRSIEETAAAIVALKSKAR
ncbi:MAG: phosphoenolpyruvate synthase regulatory protein, partial [Rhizobiaceae bacterium]